jgi:hypothetical protein
MIVAATAGQRPGGVVAREEEEALRLELEGRCSPEHYAEHSYGGRRHGAVSLSWIMQILNDGLDVINLVFLDCCRDNPEDGTFKVSGLAMEAASLTKGGVGSVMGDSQFFVGMACDPGTVAYVGREGAKHSRYTEALLR